MNEECQAESSSGAYEGQEGACVKLGKVYDDLPFYEEDPENDE